MKGKSNKIPMQLIDLEIIPLVLLPLHHLQYIHISQFYFLTSVFTYPNTLCDAISEPVSHGTGYNCEHLQLYRLLICLFMNFFPVSTHGHPPSTNIYAGINQKGKTCMHSLKMSMTTLGTSMMGRKRLEFFKHGGKIGAQYIFQQK